MRNMITDQGEAEFDNNIPKDAIFFPIVLSGMLYVFYYTERLHPVPLLQKHELLSLINTQNWQQYNKTKFDSNKKHM